MAPGHWVIFPGIRRVAARSSPQLAGGETLAPAAQRLLLMPRHSGHRQWLWIQCVFVCVFVFVEHSGIGAVKPPHACMLTSGFGLSVRRCVGSDSFDPGICVMFVMAISVHVFQERRLHLWPILLNELAVVLSATDYCRYHVTDRLWPFARVRHVSTP